MRENIVRIKVIAWILIPFLWGCTPRTNFDNAFFPKNATNFSEINSEYDDFNSKERSQPITSQIDLIFSTNRKSKGQNFDFIYYSCSNYFDLPTGKMDFTIYESTNKLLDAVNSDFDELGPYFYENFMDSAGYNIQPESGRFLYARNSSGNLDIYFLEYSYWNYDYSITRSPMAFSALNSSYDDAYPTIFTGSTSNQKMIYFTSNRNGNFDIFSAFSKSGGDLFSSIDMEVVTDTVLSSSSNDKCPYTNGNLMVFTSDRPGGFGGFDLWYSVYRNNKWNEPVNFGSKINSASDEYRPIVIVSGKLFINDMMIFSSNRPGGKGGYDLYYVGIPKMTR